MNLIDCLKMPVRRIVCVKRYGKFRIFKNYFNGGFYYSICSSKPIVFTKKCSIAKYVAKVLAYLDCYEL